MYQWVDCLTNSSSGEVVTNIDWLVEISLGTKKYYGSSETGINSWKHPVKAQMDMLKKICNHKEALMFPPYC